MTARLLRLLERESHLALEERRALERRERLDESARGMLDAGSDLEGMLKARELAAEARSGVLLSWSSALDALDAARQRARSVPPAPVDVEFWGTLGERLSRVLGDELSELPPDELRAAISRALDAVGGASPSAPPAPLLRPPTTVVAPRGSTAEHEEAELLAGVRGTDTIDRELPEDPPSLGAIDAALAAFTPDNAGPTLGHPTEELPDLRLLVPVPESSSGDEEFDSFAALSRELASEVGPSIDGLSAETTPPPPRGVSPDYDIGMRMTEEIELTPLQIRALLDSTVSPSERREPPQEAPSAEARVPPPVLGSALEIAVPEVDEQSPYEDPFASLQASLEELDAQAPEAPSETPVAQVPEPPRPPPPAARSDADFDPFADLAAELHALDPDASLSAPDDEVDGGSLEPIPGYDFAPIEDTPVPAQVVQPPPLRAITPPPAPPAADPPSLGPASDSIADRFRPTRGRLEKSVRPAPRAPDLSRPLPPAPRSAATFAALADELSSGLRDPWSELDIGDLRMSGHPGPLPQGRVPETVPAARARAQREPRAGLSAKVGIEHGSTFFTGFSGNVSRGGLFVATPNVLPHGVRVEVFFEMPDGHAISAPATVCWHRPAEQAALEGLPAGLGFRFEELSHDDEIALERFIGAQEASILYEG